VGVSVGGSERRLAPTWTEMVTEQDALAALDLARPGLDLGEWQRQAHEYLDQPQQRRRQKVIRLVRERLLDHDGGQILDSAFLRLLRGGSPHLRAGLVHGRICFAQPLVASALDALVHPALARREAPLALQDAGLIRHEAWEQWLRGCLPADTGASAFDKTRSNVQKALANVGVLDLQANTRRRIRAQRGRPHPLAFCWLLGHELVTGGRTEAPEAWALGQSFAARLFAPLPAYAATCLEAGIGAGLLRRGYLAGSARLHPGPALGSRGEG